MLLTIGFAVAAENVRHFQLGAMDRPKLEVADIFRRYGEAYRQQHEGSLSIAQRRVMTAIEVCRTAALGGHLERCDTCDYERPCYDSCANRHCPKCQSLARAAWVEKRTAEVLPTHYFHVVFSVPEQIASIAYQNKKVVYGILFRATAQTLSTIAADPKHLGAEIGFFAVLHSWGQTLVSNEEVGTIFRMPVQGGESIRLLEPVPFASWGVFGHTIVYLDSSSKPAKLKTFDAESRKLRDFGVADLGQQEKADGFAVSPDGQWVLYPRADERDSDIMLVSNFH